MPAAGGWTQARAQDSGAPAGEDAYRAGSLRRLLKLEGERLRMRQALGLGGSEVAAARADLVDHVVRRACQDAAQAAGPEAQRELAHCAVVALGGYGRRELSPFSDVDLLFLHGGRSEKTIGAFVERVLVALWDAGLTVGQSFRSARDCVSVARSDLHARTALCEARLVTGNQGLFEMLQLRLDISLWGSPAAQQGFFDQVRAEFHARRRRLGEAVCVLEPHVKEGPGGLRDLHALLWVAHARHRTRGLQALETTGMLERADYAAVRRAYDFLLRVRNQAHFSTGRKTDLLTLDLQQELADRLGYRERGGMLASELLMRDYYRHAFKLHEICRGFFEPRREEEPRRRFLSALRLPRPTRRAFEVRRGALCLRGGVVLRGGGAVLEAFERAQAEGVPLSRELERTLRDKAELVGGPFRQSREAGQALLRLTAPRGRVGAALRAMHETGVLGRLVPEWVRISFLVQHDFFHKYTVDEHTLRAVAALDELSLGRHPEAGATLARLLDELPDVRPLYLGMLLHDIAKGRGGGHVPKGVVIARRVTARLGIEEEVARKAIFLVGAHLEMSRTAEQRDLTEPAPIEAFAARVGTLERLHLLMLLTYADHRGVGPGVWNEWKASLLFELYERARRELEAQPGSRRTGPGASAREAAAARLGAEFEPHEVERHFALLSERYLRATDAARMASHFRLVRSRGASPAAFGWTDLGVGRGTELVVTAADRPGLFSLVAGTLTVHGVDILGADLFTRRDGVVLDTLRVAEVPGRRPLRPERRVHLEAALLDAVAGRVDVPEAFRKWRAHGALRTRGPRGRAAQAPRVRFDQDASAVATVVEVKAPDQPGLAYRLAHALAELGLDITSARIATAKALALDVFYVCDAQGRKLDEDALVDVEHALLEALRQEAA